MNTFNKKKGFGLIEVLVALAIMAIGFMAVATFHTSLIGESANTRNRAEAMSLAQERIEQMRNYTDLALDQDAFNDLFPISTSAANQTSHQGTNTLFTRQETITENDDTREVTVQVLWQDGNGETEVVELSTELAWRSPSLAGEVDATKASQPIVRSATGRARLGKGEVSEEERGQVDYATNGDTTGLLDRGDGDLRLTSENDVVLTLEDACELDNGERTSKPCTGFVEISGSVYIDLDEADLDIFDVHVIASDAAYCQRYIINVHGEAERIDKHKEKGLFTANGDYEYFNYTCYLGGGWHGNIGLLIDGPEWSCMGDPNADIKADEPKVAIRRVYRGMAYKIDDKDDPVTNADGQTIYYSVGVADALKLPAEGQAGHDFVIANLGSSDDTVCTEDTQHTSAIMLKNDATVNGVAGGLFAGVPTDFFCLNQNVAWVDDLKMTAFDYQIDDTCPFDPSDPPSEEHIITGDVHITASLSNANNKLDNFNVYTSDGYGNCEIYLESANFTSDLNIDVKVPYRCKVYDWGNGWSGYVQITPDISVFTCNRLTINVSEDNALTGDKDLGDFKCTDGSDSGTDPQPSLGTVTITGNIVHSGGAKLASLVFAGNQCELARNATSYTCASPEVDLSLVPTFKAVYTSTKDNVCVTSSSATRSVMSVADGLPTATVTVDSASASYNIDIGFSPDECSNLAN
ncbi:prepilin-type N-terminal cleavage/methylation domain-containing protein [Thalassotalea ponticola]|uniref:prepilin-type N-terminal cleavage/methylation domain-containing protein n=1 Tax=Thalassotalea ponticola TaxID=1523392 RepID=UPI0025B31F0E|nr:prepilin-type N-terminal cleavage/methylation domain-containing protein [Thalassotalea ponticola]MDN3651698.1 prepilin-type N-terminal cleavage/methylation domain-containing protein [Thalassotalea ponticola]